MQQNLDTSQRVRIRSVETLSKDWYILKKTTFDYLRDDGTWQTLSRETYDRGNGAAICPYNRRRKTIILTRQFRYPAYVNGHNGVLIEACAGLLEQAEPEQRIKQELEEETGYRLNNVEKVFELFMSPGSVTEKIFFFIAEYAESNKTGKGGGVRLDGEDIGVLELRFDKAMEMVQSREIVDGKTVILLQYLKTMGLMD